MKTKEVKFCVSVQSVKTPVKIESARKHLLFSSLSYFTPHLCSTRSLA
jgi:hypothetical protein